MNGSNNVSPARAEAAQRNGARGRGPRTTEGKCRSSKNALTHGLKSATPGLLLPSEDPLEYAAYQETWRASLKPANAAAEKIARAIGNLYWRLERRLEPLEHEALLRQIEGALANTKEVRARHDAENVGKMLEAMVTTMESLVPDMAGLEAILRLADQVFGFLQQIDDASPLPFAILSDWAAAQQELGACWLVESTECGPEDARARQADGQPEWFQAYASLARAARKALIAVHERVQELTAQVEKKRQEVGAQVLLDSAELRRLGRYRTMIERSVEAQLSAFQSLQKLADASR